MEGSPSPPHSMNDTFRAIASRLPSSIQLETRRARFGWQIRKHVFKDDVDPYFARLDELVAEGDWVIDVGANVGHYTLRLSELVGPSGRVFAIEPIPQTFELLCSNSRRAPYPNITLLNLACGRTTDLACMAIPSEAGQPNYYQAQIAENAPLSVLCARLDILQVPRRITLIKVDAEGSDLEVLEGAETILERDHPKVLIEGRMSDLEPWFAAHGYRHEGVMYEGPNQLFVPVD